MRLQNSQANCGPSALRNALSALGIERSAEELESSCGTTATDGTSTRGVVKGAGKIEGCIPVIIRERRRDIAALRLRFAIDAGRPVVLAWRSQAPGDHWVAAIGRLGERYLVADSADSELVISVSIENLCDHWVDGKVYEGIIL